MRILVVVAALAVALAATGSAAPRSRGTACRQGHVSPAYKGGVRRALRAKQDVWGNQLLSVPNGPTFNGASRYLKPLLFARSRGRPLTSSGVYYLPFAQPLGVRGARVFALHVADGSQILSQRADGPSLTVFVGPGGNERYGSCLSRLTPAWLAEGYLPILETAYVDANGVRYRQESFAVRGLGTRELVSFIRLTADAPSGRGATLRLALSAPGLAAARSGLVRRGATHLAFSSGARVDGSSIRYHVAPGEARTIYAAWFKRPAASRLPRLDRGTYAAARQGVTDFWQTRLGKGAALVVPEERVLHAEQSLLIQELIHTWRYSVGNSYQEFSFRETLDVAEVMASYGYGDVTRAMLRTSLKRLALAASNSKIGEELVATARYYRLYADRGYVQEVTHTLTRLVNTLARQINRRTSGGLLDRERFSSDISTPVYGLHSQAVVWQGLRAMGSVWAQTGHQKLAARCRLLSARLGAALRRAVHTSKRRLKDGTLFVPAALLDPGKPFDALTASKAGSYWNLVIPYALASGFFPPGRPEANGILEYMLRHGSRLLGLVRAGAYALYGKPAYPVSGTNQVYGLNVARFLADNDHPDQLVLSLYGMLAAAMTPNTFVSGEAASVAPLEGTYYRSMYQPPNGASNATFLETLRLMLVHETPDPRGRPAGLQLAHSTPRLWLKPGKSIEVEQAPTSFGPLSYRIDSLHGQVVASIDVPSRRPPRMLSLRLRLPAGEKIAAVRLDERPVHFDARTGTIDLSGRRGTLTLVAAVRG